MNNLNEDFDFFDNEYLEESKPILEKFLQRNLSLAEVEEIVNNFLELEQLVRRLNEKLDK